MGVKCVLRWVNGDATKPDHPRAVLAILKKALEGLDGRVVSKWKIQCANLRVGLCFSHHLTQNEDAKLETRDGSGPYIPLPNCDDNPLRLLPCHRILHSPKIAKAAGPGQRTQQLPQQEPKKCTSCRSARSPSGSTSCYGRSGWQEPATVLLLTLSHTDPQAPRPPALPLIS